MRNDGNLLGTIKSLDLLGVQTLNCTENAGQRVHDVCNQTHMGLPSRLAFKALVPISPHGPIVPFTRLRNRSTASGDWCPATAGLF